MADEPSGIPSSHSLPEIEVPPYDPEKIYNLPYDREVKFLRSNGLCWFEDASFFPEQPSDHSLPYDFYPPSSGLYCVVDKNGTPCLYNAVTGTFYYNQGRGRLFGMTTVHTHDALFEEDSPAKILRSIPAGQAVLTTKDTNYAYTMVDEIPDPNLVENKVVVPSQPAGTAAKGQVLVARYSGGRYAWEVLAKPEEGIGVVSNIRSSKQGYRVSIRWSDPDDKLNDTATEVRISWRYTRLVRKLNSVPSGPNDGIIVVHNSVRNAYSEYKHDFIDYLPPNVSGTWYYKFYTYSSDGVVSTSLSSEFSPLELDWSKMSQYIRNGLAPAIFAVGDIIELTCEGEPQSYTGNPIDNTFYQTLTFEVAGFDLATAPGYRHTMTLVSRGLINFSTNHPSFDDPWGNVKLVDNERATKSETYYVRNGESYIIAAPQPTPGTVITASNGYYKRISDARATTGSNRWSTSTLRTWLNAVNIFEYFKSSDVVADAEKDYYTKNSDGTYSTVTRKPGVSYNPSRLGWYERGDYIQFGQHLTPYVYHGMDVYPEAPTPLLIALKALEPAFAKCIIETKNTTAVAPAQDLTAQEETTADKVFVPSYTQIYGLANGTVQEGTPFGQDLSKIRKVGDVPAYYWLRSPELTGDISSIMSVSNEGDVASCTAAWMSIDIPKQIAVCIVLG